MKYLLVVAYVSWLGYPPSLKTYEMPDKAECEKQAKPIHKRLNIEKQHGTARVWCHPIKYSAIHAQGWPDLSKVKN